MNLGFYLLYGLSLIMFALPGISVADFQKSQLPLPDNMDADDVRVLEEIIKLEVYRDTEDPNKFHYVPPFHICQFVEGATSTMLFSTKIEKYDLADRLHRERKSSEMASYPPGQQEGSKMGKRSPPTRPRRIFKLLCLQKRKIPI